MGSPFGIGLYMSTSILRRANASNEKGGTS